MELESPSEKKKSTPEEQRPMKNRKAREKDDNMSLILLRQEKYMIRKRLPNWGEKRKGGGVRVSEFSGKKKGPTHILSRKECAQNAGKGEKIQGGLLGKAN